jgi:hypothetical protein
MPGVQWVINAHWLPHRRARIRPSQASGRRLVARPRRPPRSLRKAAVVSLGVELDRQDLVKLNDIRLEAQP